MTHHVAAVGHRYARPTLQLAACAARKEALRARKFRKGLTGAAGNPRLRNSCNPRLQVVAVCPQAELRYTYNPPTRRLTSGKQVVPYRRSRSEGFALPDELLTLGNILSTAE